MFSQKSVKLLFHISIYLIIAAIIFKQVSFFNIIAGCFIILASLVGIFHSYKSSKLDHPIGSYFLYVLDIIAGLIIIVY